MKLKLISLIILINSLIILTSCGTMDFGSGIKIPSFLIYAALFVFIAYYLFFRKK